MAKNEIIKKTKSIDLHQIGDSAQQLVLHAFTTNNTGVIKQCIAHKVLAIIPILSG